MSSSDLFTFFERDIDKIDADSFEQYLLDDLNCNLLLGIADNKSPHNPTS